MTDKFAMLAEQAKFPVAVFHTPNGYVLFPFVGWDTAIPRLERFVCILGMVDEKPQAACGVPVSEEDIEAISKRYVEYVFAMHVLEHAGKNPRLQA